jgi:[histone H3]-dimethyl-L-lysine9 demethylase
MSTALNDIHRRTSISQLLNPLANTSHEESPSSPSRAPGIPSALPQNGHHDHQDGSAPGASFQLRSASWELGQGPKRTDGPDPSRPYHYSPFSNEYTSDARAARPRDGGNISGPSGPSGAWPAPHEVSNMPYGTPVLAPMYSDERTG